MTTPDTTMTPHQAMRALLGEHNITMTAARLPLSDPGDPLQFRWSVVFFKGGREFLDSPYRAGVDAFLPTWWPKKASHSAMFEYDNALRESVRTGKVVRVSSPSFPVGWMEVKVDLWPDPDPVDVLSCLLLDGGAIDFLTYESWADEYGHDREERTYRKCLETGLKLRAALGEDLLRTLRDLAREL